jgi:hypothetical protein
MADDEPIVTHDANEPEQEPDTALAHPSVKFELRDIWFRPIFIGALIGIGIGALQLYFIKDLFRVHERTLAQRRASDFPLAEHPSTVLPLEPRLEQLDRMAEIEKPNVYLRELEKEKQLASYGSTSEKGFVHIPIERAMQRTAGHLPVRKQNMGQTENANGLIDAGESNSGRMFREQPR